MSGLREAAERRIIRALGSIGTATLASRILGFVRDMVVALAFGAGPVTDAFFVAFRIPNMLRRLLAEGALSTAVIPVFSEYLVKRPRPELLRMLRAVLTATLIGLLATTAAGIVLAPWIVRVIAPGFSADAGHHALAVLLTRVMFPYLVLVGLGALAVGLLNAEGRFFAPALGPALLNVGMITSVLALAGRLDPPILALAIGVLVGGVAQLAIQLPGLARLGLLVPPSRELAHPALARILGLLGPSVFGLAAVQVTVFVNTLLASLLAPGSISFLYYADRVMEFPLGVFGIALASASLPTMSRQAAAGDTRGIADTLNFALRLSFWISVPASVGLVVLRTPITRVLFERGRFSAADTDATAVALAWYALGLAGFSASRIAAQAFYAIGEPATAVRMGIVSVAANIVAAVFLMTPLAHGGLALASSVAAYVNLMALAVAARRRFGRIGGRALAASVARTVTAAVALAVWSAALVWLWPVRARLLIEVIWLAVAIGGGVGIYCGTSLALGASEPRVLLQIVSRRRRVDA
ncbi:MAG: murein biosynthesis integral membrane protein MurJ [Candidatus Rokubacteria bacterium]|nr:murein biosynthesis integral membrane protein MurJ [Candidatus Rokubacteria bacterium]